MPTKNSVYRLITRPRNRSSTVSWMSVFVLETYKISPNPESAAKPIMAGSQRDHAKPASPRPPSTSPRNRFLRSAQRSRVTAMRMAATSEPAPNAENSQP